MGIFNAVLCSAGWFFAEILREHYVEIKRERQYMRSLVADLKDDNQLLKEGMDEAKELLAALQSIWKQIEGKIITGPKARIIEMVEQVQY